MASYMASIAFAVLFAVLFTIAMSLLFYCWIYVHSTQSELKDLTARILASSMSAGQTFGASATEISDQERPLVSSFRRASAVNLQASFQRHVPRNAACATVKSFEEASGNFGFASSPSPYLRSEGKHGAHPQGSREVLSERIRRVLRKYAPVRLRELPSLMQQYDGRLDALLYELVSHYGPEPHETEARAVRRALFHREAFVLRLQQFFMERCIDRASDFEWMHHACDEYSGREHVLWSILTEKYGDELPPMVPRWTVFERNIIALWVRYDPLSIDTVHFSTIVKETAERWKTNVSELFQVLGRKYKIPADVVKKYTQATRSSRVLPIEPAPSVACSYPLERSEGDKAAHERTDCVVSMTPHNQYLNPAPSGKRRVQNENENDTVSQIRRMYAWYCPQYLPDIEFDLEEYHTRSVEFLHKLVLLYGPVPSRTLDDGSTSLHSDFSMATLNPNGSQKQPAHTAHDEIGLSDTFDTFHFDDVHSANKNIRGELPVSNCFAIAHRDWIIPAPGRSSEPALRKGCFMDVRPSIRPIPRDNSTRAGSRSQSEWNSDTEEDDAREWDDIWTCSVVQWPGPSSRARRFKKKWIHIPKLNDFNTHGQSETHDLENTLLRTSGTLTLKEVGDGVQQKKASSKCIAFVIRLETEDLVLSDYLPVYYGEGPEFWDLLCERCAELGADSLSHNSSSDRVENMITVQIRPPKSLSQDSRGTSKVAALPPVTVTDAFFRWFLSFWQNAANEHFRTRTIQYPLWLSTPTREKPENSKKKNHPALPEVGSQPPAPPTAYQWTQTVQLEVIPNRNTSSRDGNPRKTQQPLQNVYEFPLLFQIRLYDEWMRYSRSARITIRHISLKPRDPAEYRANKVSKAPRSEEELASHWLSVAEQKQVASAHTWGQVLYRWMKEAGKA